MMGPVFADLYKLPEDERIKIIGTLAMSGKVVGFIVSDTPGTPERYIAKLQEHFPGIRIIDRVSGPIAQVVTIRVGPPARN